MARPPVSEWTQVNFRMPADLRDRIRASAEKDGVSMNAKIVDALTAMFPTPLTTEDVVRDVALQLGLVEPELRADAIQELVKLARAGKLDKMAEIEAVIWRNSD
jgi:hypothetical protein